MPLAAIFLTTTIACLLGLINIGSSVAFNDVISLTINGLYGTYLLSCGLLLWRRCTGFIKPGSQDTFDGSLNSNDGLFWGPFRLPGVLGIVTNVIACVYLIIVLFFSFWPPATPTTLATTNYSVLMTGAVILFSVFLLLCVRP